MEKVKKMSQQTTNFGTIIDDMKTSLKLAYHNMLSYFLANLGMIVFLVLVLAIVAVPLIAVLVWIGPSALEAWALSLTNMSTASLFASGILAVSFILLPLMALLFLVHGSIYGISKEVVETGTTTAESSFSWLRHNFITFAGAGVIMTLIVIVPQLLVAAAVAYFNGYIVTGWNSIALSVFFFAYSFVTIGLTSMVMPAIVNGKGVQEAFVGSFKLAIQRFDRVFGLLTAIVLLGLLSFSPILIGAAAAALGVTLTLFEPLIIAAGLWSVVAAFLWLLLFIPMTYIAFTRVYHDLTGGVIVDSVTPTAEVPMV